VLAGDGETFSAGGNLNRLLAARVRDPAEQYASIEALHDWVRTMRSIDKPVVAAVEGAAAGAGFSLVMACDMIVAADDARFVMAYVKVGLSPDGGATQWLGTRLPYPLAYELLATGAPIGAARLHALGVVNQLVPRGQAIAAALQLAAQLADGPPRVLARIKRMLDAAAPERLSRQLDHERDAFLESFYEADAGEGIQAFLDKRPPRFGGSDSA
jgi:enoyl-CoA hydratase/carnithine racemase